MDINQRKTLVLYVFVAIVGTTAFFSTTHTQAANCSRTFVPASAVTGK